MLESSFLEKEEEFFFNRQEDRKEVKRMTKIFLPVRAKRKIQNITDLIMTALLPVLMVYSLIGEDVHEWAGIVLFALFLLHNGLNWKWYKNLFQARYNGVRVLGTVVNILIFLLMLSLMASGIVMSRYVFQFLAIDGGASLARTVHLAASYWFYVLASVHLGLHGGDAHGPASKGIPNGKGIPQTEYCFANCRCTAFCLWNLCLCTAGCKRLYAIADGICLL